MLKEEDIQTGAKFYTPNYTVKHYMTCFIDRSLSGARMKLHTSMLGTFFVYTLGLSMPIFKKKSSRRFLGKSSKLCVLHKKSFLCNTQSLELFTRNLRKDFFLKIGILSPKVYTKKVPNFEIVWPTPGTLRRLTVKGVYLVSHSLVCASF